MKPVLWRAALRGGLTLGLILLVLSQIAQVPRNDSPGSDHPSANPPSPTPPSPDATHRPLSESDRIKALPDDESKWLTEFVAAIILRDERKLFLELTEPYQREVFREAFWERRERSGLPSPLGPGYRFRYQELRRLADDVYDGWRQDAGRMVLRYGEPASIEKAKGCDETFRDLEVWTYSGGQIWRQITKFLFYRPGSGGPRKLWNLTVPNSDVFLPNSCQQSFAELFIECPEAKHPLFPKCYPCQALCDTYRVYAEIKSQEGSAARAAAEYGRMFDPAEVSTEGLDELARRFAIASDWRAKKLSVEGPSSGPTPEPARPRKLSHEEILERIIQLEPKYKQWLDVAGPLMTEDELSQFVQLPSQEKDEFIQKFWKRHR